jgi:long-chain fatty acid transport protein
MNKTHCSTITIASLFGAACLTTSSGWALGFRNPDQGARATGQGEAYVAQADDASAIYYNPAGLTQVKGTEFTSGGMIVFRNARYNPPGPGGNVSLTDPAYLAHFYGVSDFGMERWRIGIGVNLPFGNAMDWGENTPFKYGITKSELRVINFQPTLAFKVNDQLSIGAGLNILDAETSLERMVPFSQILPSPPFPPGLPDGRFRFYGNGQALGGTAGVLWRPCDQHSFGVTYRSPFEIRFDGHAAVSSDPTGGAFGRSPAHAAIQFPQSVTIGYAFRPMKKLKLEVDAEWTDWDSLNKVRLHSSNATFDNDPGSTLLFNWKSGWFYEFGAQYNLNDNWALRAGYIYSENTVPNSTFSPVLPDGDRHVFSVGAGYSIKHVQVDLVYQYSLTIDRTINNTIVPGEWQYDSHAIMVTSSLRF